MEHISVTNDVKECAENWVVHLQGMAVFLIHAKAWQYPFLENISMEN